MSYDYWMESAEAGDEQRLDPDFALMGFEPTEPPGDVPEVVGAAFAVEGRVYSRGGGRRGLAGSASPGANYTGNVAPMWFDALGYRLSELAGKTGAEAEPEIRRAIVAMRADPGKYRGMNPANGWGDYEGALAYIEGMAEMCRRFPAARLAFWV